MAITPDQLLRNRVAPSQAPQAIPTPSATPTSTFQTPTVSGGLFGGSAPSTPTTTPMQASPMMTTAVPQTADTTPNIRFVKARYTAYNIILCIVIAVATTPVLEARDAFSARMDELNTLDMTSQRISTRNTQFAAQRTLVENIEKTKATVVSCFNFQSSCDQVAPNILSQSGVIQRYLQLGTLSTDKMKIDEKKILKSLNEYVFQKNPFGNGKRQSNGSISSIVIEKGSQDKRHEKLWKVPITLSARFDTTDDLLSFINNIEQTIFYKTDDPGDSSVLYDIDAINYDIVNYQEAQDITINLLAYYYQ